MYGDPKEALMNVSHTRSDAGRRTPGNEVRSPEWDPFAWSLGYWDCCARSAEIWWTRHAGMGAVAARAEERLQALVRLARDHAPFYRDRYRGLPERVRVAELPVVTKPELMAHFDEAVTDPALKLASVQRFLADARRIGDKFLGRYYVWKSSGSTGVPGVYVQDAEAMAIYDALVLAHVDVARWSADFATRMLAAEARAALIVATEDHFASIASWQRAQRANPGLQARSFSVLTPIPELVRDLNAFRPAFVASYPTVLCVLAAEQNAGRLHIRPASLWSGGEWLGPAAHAAIESAFGCPVVNEYGASECLAIGYECRAGWLHVNADWVVLEPVDAAYRAVPPGVTSDTVLLSNLINRAQPILRYDLGDRVLVNPAPCACGNPLPAIRIEGRRDEVLAMRAADGRVVPLLPMALGTVIESATALHRYQVVQTGPAELHVRLDDHAGEAERRAAWTAVAGALRTFLAAQGLASVTLAFDPRPPELDARAGKLHVVGAAQGLVPVH